MMELDIATVRALQDGKNGLSGNLRADLSKFDLDIPEYYSMFDVRKPAKQYVEDKLKQILENVFIVRRGVEKTLSRNELLAYDRMLAAHLTKEELLPKLKEEVEMDRN